MDHPPISLAYYWLLRLGFAFTFSSSKSKTTETFSCTQGYLNKNACLPLVLLQTIANLPHQSQFLRELHRVYQVLLISEYALLNAQPMIKMAWLDFYSCFTQSALLLLNLRCALNLQAFEYPKILCNLAVHPDFNPPCSSWICSWTASLIFHWLTSCWLSFLIPLLA